MTDRASQIDAVLQRMSEGESERSACEAVGIPRATFRTTALRKQAGDQYAKALEGLALDQVVKLETILEEVRDGRLEVNAARLEIDTRKWLASKFLPKLLGDKLAVGGADDLPAIQNAHVGLDSVISKLTTATGASETDALRALAATEIRETLQ